MYAGLIEFTVNLEKKQELFAMVQKEVLVALKRGTGCLAIVPFSIEDKPERMYVISFWQSKQDWAGTCTAASFEKIREQMSPYLASPITVQRCIVETTLCDDFMKPTDYSQAIRTIAKMQEELNRAVNAILDNVKA